ncbi:hypothetical protein N8I77_002182 [Diaporthe amygdali]|uniref:Uncharacterized protein n=1 Tax=Phomopsis amygdali TaxID=1214568 RepID=A0AAD9SQF7_PHOAM|nr:hypothetical protein N8I77_002182 [Diaporthe amygdali]
MRCFRHSHRQAFLVVTGDGADNRSAQFSACATRGINSCQRQTGKHWNLIVPSLDHKAEPWLNHGWVNHMDMNERSCVHLRGRLHSVNTVVTSPPPPPKKKEMGILSCSQLEVERTQNACRMPNLGHLVKAFPPIGANVDV